jgi:AcrR family transcriptional regulator
VSDIGPTIPGSPSVPAPERLPRGRHDLPREFVARTQRDRLIDAMARTVATHGYAGASLTEVCAAAGVSTKAFYTHFSDKQECFLTAFDRGVGLLQKSVLAAYRQPGAWPDRIHRGLGVLLRILASEPAFAALAVVEVTAAGPVALQRRRDLLAGFTRFFADAPRPPGVQPLPTVVVEAVIGGVYGVIFDHIVADRAAELPGRLADLTYFVLVPFVGASKAAATIAPPAPPLRR